MLVSVNLFLLVLVLFRDWRSTQFTESARDEAILILADHGIALDKDILPQEMPLGSMLVTRDPEAEAVQAAGLLGADTQGAPDSNTYHSSLGEAQFYPNGEFSATFQPGAYPLNGKRPEDHAVEVLSAMGFEAQVVETSPGGDVVTLCQLWEGVPIFSCRATLVYQDGALHSIRNTSRRLTGTPQSTTGEAPMTVVTALLRFWETISARGDICKEITRFTAGYGLDYQAQPATLTPTWEIVTDTGVYYMNAVTGESQKRAEGGT